MNHYLLISKYLCRASSTKDYDSWDQKDVFDYRLNKSNIIPGGQANKQTEPTSELEVTCCHVKIYQSQI